MHKKQFPMKKLLYKDKVEIKRVMLCLVIGQET